MLHSRAGMPRSCSPSTTAAARRSTGSRRRSRPTAGAGTSSSPPGRIGTPGFLDDAGVRELAARGHDVGSHSHSHPFLTRLPDDAVAEEWRRSKDVLEEVLGREISTASIPTGYYEERIGRAAAAAGYRALFTSEPWTEARDLDGMALHGRFAVTVATPLQRVRGLASHSRLAIGSEALAWEGRKVAKKALGPAYGRLRHVLLARRR